MKRLFGTVMVAATLVLGASSQAQAQDPSFTFGPGVAYHDDFDLGVGVWFSTPMASIHEQVSLWGSFIYFFPSEGASFGASSVDLKYFEINGGLSYAFVTEGTIVPFVSAGLNIARASVDYDGPGEEFIGDLGSNTDIGLSVGGGIRTMLGESLTGVAGARLELGGGEGFVIEAGLGFPMGG
jgi:hypothetical protein